MKSYPMPFPRGTKYEEIKEDEGSEPDELSHRRFTSTREAKDLTVDFGTPVLAIESGKVAFVKNDSKTYINPKTHFRYRILFGEKKKRLSAYVRNKLNDELMELARRYTNYVQVIQVDDLIAEYVHLGEINVNMDQRIEQGELIGSVGLNGITTGAHLHINLTEILSVPFELVERR